VEQLEGDTARPFGSRDDARSRKFFPRNCCEVHPSSAHVVVSDWCGYPDVWYSACGQAPDLASFVCWRSMRPRRLLCVDDDSAFRHFYETLLGSYGFDVILAANGRQALKLFLSRKIDAVVTDLEMPGMTGTELASRLKRLRPDLPVLLVSGSKSIVETPPETVDASVAKGIPVTKLVDQLEMMIAKRFSRPPSLRPRRFLPLGSMLASIAVGAFLLPRIIK
jgi:CheY-like chemotaxis protein